MFYAVNINQKNETKYFSINLFIILLGVLLLYGLFMSLSTRNPIQTLLQLGLLLVPLILAYPFLEKGNIQDLTYIFDRKELVLLYIPFLSSLPIFVHLLLLQVFPFALLYIAQYFLIVRRSQFGFAYYILLGLITLLFAHTFYFPLDRSTIKIVGSVLGITALVTLGVIGVIFYKTRNLRTVFLSAIGLGSFIGGIVITVIFSRQQFVLTPFEINALQIVTQQHKPVIYLSSQNTLIYKAVHPIFYDYPKFSKNLTGITWQQVNMLPKNIDGKLVVIPRYLGTDISTDEIQKRQLQVIFDNGQIAVLEKK